MAADEQTARDTEPKAKSEMVTTRPGENGSTIYHVNSGYEITYPTYLLDYMRFAPSDLNVSVGDTVEWSSPTAHNFHNVLFGEEPEALVAEPQPAGPPKIYFNSDIALPSGDADYDGSGLYSSGLLVGSEDPPEAGVRSYSLSFSQPGRFEYICAVHYHNGMDGRIVVADNTGGVPGMPTTGSGSDNTLPLLALLAGLVLASTGVGLRLRIVPRR
jgi:plastocyanin